MERMLTPKEVASLLGVRPSRLARWRREGRGPAYIRVGPHPRYPEGRLRSWVADRLVEPSEGQPGGGRVTREREVRYGEAALAQAARRVAAAAEHTRNDTLNRESFGIGRLVGGGVLDEDRVRSALLSAAVERGLAQPEASRTITSGLAAGKKTPRRPPCSGGAPWTGRSRRNGSKATPSDRRVHLTVARRPPRSEVQALWQAARPVDARGASTFIAWARAGTYLAGRGFDVEGAVAAVDVVRCAPHPAEHHYPSWWPPSWAFTWNLVARAYEPDGTLASVHGRAIVASADPKTRWPRGYQARGLLFADNMGREFLRGQRLAVLDGVLIVEGLTDTLAAAVWARGRQRRTGTTLAVLGITAGGAAGLASVKTWPRKIPLYVATDWDETGHKYARAVRMAVPREVEVRRARLGGAG